MPLQQSNFENRAALIKKSPGGREALCRRRLLYRGVVGVCLELVAEEALEDLGEQAARRRPQHRLHVRAQSPDIRHAPLSGAGYHYSLVLNPRFLG